METTDDLLSHGPYIIYFNDLYHTWEAWDTEENRVIAGCGYLELLRRVLDENPWGS